MRRVIILTIAGGAVAAYFAYPHGYLASALAYLLGGMLGALLGLMSYLYSWGQKARTDKALAPSHPTAGNPSSGSSEADL